MYVKKIILAIALLMPLSAMASSWNGIVVGISDGDTLKVLNVQKQQIKIRLVEIDAPEKTQAFGEQSKQSLSDICFKKKVVVEDKGTDKYKRTLGRLSCDGVDANAEQVKRGMAWAYTKYLTDPIIADLEKTAKDSGTGLWADENPSSPWDFRHGGKAAKSSNNHVEKMAANGELKCGEKSYCKQMSTCEEAMHYLNECGLSKLDKDSDGVPCESLCR
jgi:endonuclease YncB( thermonuclease family)